MLGVEKSRSICQRAFLKVGGRVLMLDFSAVWKPREPLYDAYSFKALPLLGKLVANHSESYRYLAEPIRVHSSQEELK